MTIIPVCLNCSHLRRTDSGPLVCDAFPDRDAPIPPEILGGKDDHSGPVAGDHGIRFEPRTVDTVHTLKPARADEEGRINFGEKATRTFVSGLVERLKARFGLTYRDKPDA